LIIQIIKGLRRVKAMGRSRQHTEWRHPIRRCPSCNGGKKNAGSNSQRWGTCRRCGGKGESCAASVRQSR
jgi:hypothetical protein